MDKYLLEDGTGHYQLEDASGDYLLEQQAGGVEDVFPFVGGGYFPT